MAKVSLRSLLTMLIPTPGLPTLAVLWHTCNKVMKGEDNFGLSDLEEVRLHVVETCVEDQLKVR